MFSINMNNTGFSVRDMSIDLAKGIGILLVVLFHTSFQYTSHCREFVYGFHMPLFFYLSGIVYNPNHYSFSSLLKKKGKTLLLPTIYFTIITFIIYYFAVDYDFKNIPMVPPEALWFLPVLFFAHIIGHFFSVVQNRGGKLFLISMLLLLSFYTLRIPYQPFSILSVPAASFFLCIGNLKYMLYKRIGIKTAIAILFVYCVLIKLLKVEVEMYDNTFFPAFWAFLMSVIGIVFVMSLCFNVAKSRLCESPVNKSVIWFGRNSLAIVCVHPIFIRLSQYYIKPFICNRYAFILMELAVTLSLTVLFVVIINNYAPFLIGKKYAIKNN